MKLTLTLNIGKLDANRLGLEKTLEGETVDVPQKAADELIRRGWAVPEGGKVDPSKAAPIRSSAQLPSEGGAVRSEDMVEGAKPAPNPSAASERRPK